MKVMAILMIIGAAVLGIYEGDCTAAVIIGMLALPQILTKKSPSGRNGYSRYIRTKGK